MNCYSRSTIPIKSTQFESDWKQQFPQTPLTKIGTIVEKNPLGNIIDSVSQKPIDNLKSFDHFKAEIVSIPPYYHVIIVNRIKQRHTNF